MNPADVVHLRNVAEARAKHAFATDNTVLMMPGLQRFASSYPPPAIGFSSSNHCATTIPNAQHDGWSNVRLTLMAFLTGVGAFLTIAVPLYYILGLR